jgi:hypothetical protein
VDAEMEYSVIMKTTGYITILLICIGAVFSANAAPKSSASFEKALQDAEMIASLSTDWSVQRTSGASMGEFFGDNSLILVQKATITQIRVGMMIVYRSSTGELISHKIVEHEGSSVRTMGASNWNIDPEPVTSDMIIGTVFGVFHTAGAPEGTIYASNGQELPTALCKTF